MRMHPRMGQAGIEWELGLIVGMPEAEVAQLLLLDDSLSTPESHFLEQAACLRHVALPTASRVPPRLLHRGTAPAPA
jgi:hypothetical protein